MAKKPVVAVNPVDPQSIEDVGFLWGKTTSDRETLARYVMGKVPSLGEPEVELPDETKDRLKTGLLNYYNQVVNPPVFYVVADGHFIQKPENEWTEFQGEKRQLDVYIAFGVDQSTLIHLREHENGWYKEVQGLKTAFSKYFSNACGEIVKKARELKDRAQGIKKTRALTKVFSVREKEMLDSLLEFCKKADGRGNDPTADLALTRKRVAAYFAVTK